jgi:CheY-like chemotaxis protein
MNALAYPLRILIVDDDPRMCDALRKLVRPALTRDSLLVACARAEDALTLARNVEFDVVLCDLQLPQMDGVGFWATLERTNPSLAKRTILMTQVSQEGRARPALRRPRVRVLAKNATREELLATIADVAGEPIRAAS